MADVIKINQSSIDQATTKLYHKLKEYEEEVVSAQVGIMLAEEKLEGQGYDNLFSQIDKTITEQKKIVVECILLREAIDSFLKEMASAEDRARGKFPT